MQPDPLLAVPVATVTRVEPLPAKDGLLLVQSLPPRGRFAAWLERRLGLSRERRFELDAIGARFFSEIDGQRSLAEIQAILVRELGLPPRAAEQAVIVFTTGLMRRGLVALRVEAQAGRAGHA
jgi:hypothetical protein